jgi:hypothetical protein
MTGIEPIAEERKEQVERHGRTVAHDVRYNPNGDLAMGAVALITKNRVWFPRQWDKRICTDMIRKEYKERLVIAGALIAAELDRIQSI